MEMSIFSDVICIFWQQLLCFCIRGANIINFISRRNIIIFYTKFADFRLSLFSGGNNVSICHVPESIDALVGYV